MHLFAKAPCSYGYLCYYHALLSPQEFFAKEVQPRVYQALREALATLRDAGAEIKAVSLPDTKFAFSAYYVIASAEASSNLARYDGIRYGALIPSSGLSLSLLCTTIPASIYTHCAFILFPSLDRAPCRPAESSSARLCRAGRSDALRGLWQRGAEAPAARDVCADI